MAKFILVCFFFSLCFLIPNILLFLSRREVGDSSVKLSLYLLNSMFS